MNQPTGDRAVVLLGRGHPLVRATESLQILLRHSLTVAAILVGATIARAEGDRWSMALAISAAVVLAGFALATASKQQARREAALDLITAGRDGLPVPAVQRERRRLRGHRRRRALARTLERLLDEAWSSKPPLRTMTVPFHVTVLRTVTPELRAVIDLVRGDGAPTRGVAAVQRLITDAGSPLYRAELEPLRRELELIQRLLIG
jgi:hypothetical protein